MRELNPPAIVHEYKAEMEQLAYEACSALEIAQKLARTTLERYREAGEALEKAKKRVKHGTWLAWLEHHGINRFQAARAMRVAANWGKCASDAHLKDAFRIFAADGEEGEKIDATAGPSRYCAGCQRKGPRRDCAECVAIQRVLDVHVEREQGDDTEEIRDEIAAKAADKKKVKRGGVAWDPKELDDVFGRAMRLIDRAGNAQGEKESDDALSLRKLIAEWKAAFDSWLAGVRR